MRVSLSTTCACLIAVSISGPLSAINISDFGAGLDSWRYDFGGSGNTIIHDAAEGSPGNPLGAAKLTFNFPLAGGIAFTGDEFFPATDLTGASNVLFDVKVAPGSGLDAFGNHGFMQFVSRETNGYTWGAQTGQNLPAVSGWQTFSIPTTANGGLDMAATRAFTLQLYGGPAQNTSGPVTLWLDNIRTDASATSGPLYSFETGLEGWVPQGGADSDYVSHAQFTGNATEGTKSMQVVTGTGFGRDVNAEPSVGSPVFSAISTAATTPNDFTLDFDVTFDNNSWSSLTNGGTYFNFNVYGNSTIGGSTGGFNQVLDLAPVAPGFTGTKTISAPLSALNFNPAGSFIQFGIGTNSDPAGTGTVSYYVDNVRLSPVVAPPEYDETVLFSWENGTTQGWANGFSDAPYFHTRTLTSEGATDGSMALRFQSPQAGFAWGSQFELDSSVATGNPANQSQINTLVSQVNGAEKLAFDVTFPDQGLNNPDFLTLKVNISNVNAPGSPFYQSPDMQAGDPVALMGQTITIEIPMSDFTSGAMNLGTTDLIAGEYFRFALFSNSLDTVDFIIDNFRLLSLSGGGLDGDFDNDGDVDGHDFLAWQRNPNVGALADWQANYGMSQTPLTAAASAVPEPSTLLLVLGLMVGQLRRRK